MVLNQSIHLYSGYYNNYRFLFYSQFQYFSFCFQSTYIITSSDLILKFKNLLPEMKHVTTIIYMKGRITVDINTEFKGNRNMIIIWYINH